MTVVPGSVAQRTTIPVHMKFVLGGGASGGFLSWVYSETVGSRLMLPVAAAIAACIVLGAAAALVSVYLVANSDVENLPRLIAFALICGISWKPVLDSSRTYVSQRQDAAASDERSTAALGALQKTPTAAQPKTVAAATEATTSLLKTSDHLNDPELKEKAEARTNELITAISATGKSDPETAEAALTEVKTAAEATGNTQLANRAKLEMQRLETQPKPSLQTVPAQLQHVPLHEFTATTHT